MVDEREVPEHRCGFELTPEHRFVNWDGELSVWRGQFNAISCCREPWRDSDRCIWHAETEDKPVDQLKTVHAEGSKRIDGVFLVGVDAGDELSFQEYELIFPDFSETNLSNACFAQARLLGARFRRANLERANFSGAIPVNVRNVKKDFPTVNFNESIIREAKFNDAWFLNSDFTETKGRWADFSDANLKKAQFSGANLRETKFTSTDLRDAKFPDAHLGKAELNPATLRNAQFPRANLDKADLSNSSLDHANFSNAELTEADFSGASLISAKFPDAELSEAVFTDAEPRDVQFSDANLESTNFVDATAVSAKFQHADLKEADFSGALLMRANFADAKLPKAQLTNANLQKAKFPASRLVQSEMENADARDAYFGAANLQEADLTGTDLRGANLINAHLDQAVLSDTRIDATTEFGESPDSWAPTCVYQSHPAMTYPPRERDQLEAAEWVYRRLQKLHEENALSAQARGFHVRKEEARREYHRLRKETAKTRKDQRISRREYRSLTLNWLLTRHGESLERILWVSAGTIFLSAFLYPFGGISSSENDVVYQYPVSTWLRVDTLGEAGSALIEAAGMFLQGLYFSVITFTTIGYGDLYPNGICSKILVGLESLAGAVLIALFIFVLGRRVSR